jgi:hypothetical protein
MAKKYRSEPFAAIHETMEGLHEVGAIDKQTMREFDEACLTSAQALPPRGSPADSAARAYLTARVCTLLECIQKPGV